MFLKPKELQVLVDGQIVDTLFFKKNFGKRRFQFHKLVQGNVIRFKVLSVFPAKTSQIQFSDFHTEFELIGEAEDPDDREYPGEVPAEKPVIYLYPEKETEVSVKLNYKGKLLFTYPNYRNGWQVMASPNGTLIDKNTQKEYQYLFWEGKTDYQWKISQGYCVKSEEIVPFLEEKLQYLGLTPKEYNEMIVYWAPRMEQTPYCLIHFDTQKIHEIAPLEITPTPDEIFRIFMVWKPLNEFQKVKTQPLPKFQRKGFTVVEWGGTQLIK